MHLMCKPSDDMLDNFEMLYSCSEVYIRKFFETNKWMKSMFRDHKSSEYWLRELIPLQLRHRATICTEDAQLYQVAVNFNTTRKDIGEDKFTTRTTRFSTVGIIFLEHNTIMLGNVRLSQLVFSLEQVIHGKVWWSAASQHHPIWKECSSSRGGQKLNIVLD